MFMNGDTNKRQTTFRLYSIKNGGLLKKVVDFYLLEVHHSFIKPLQRFKGISIFYWWTCVFQSTPTSNHCYKLFVLLFGGLFIYF
jgi:hypothetical protein